MGLSFFLVNALFGAGLAMDAFSVSIADGLSEPGMRKKKGILISFVFGFFQFMMPVIGWIIVHTVVNAFSIVEKIIPWVALVLLCKIGIGMIIEGVVSLDADENHDTRLTKKELLIQAIATSIDALSVGLTLSGYTVFPAMVASTLIGVITFIICMTGILIGKKLGEKFAGKATIFGGLILIGIGLKIIITYLFF